MIYNVYASLQEYKDYTSTTDTDATDDGVIELFLEATSRFMDGYCNRTFYPRVEARLYDTPGENFIFFDDDFLEDISITRGESSDTISSTDYTLVSANFSPKWGLKLKDISSLSWESSSDLSDEQNISVTAVWGYRENYTQRGWINEGTLAAAITTTTASTFTMTDGHTIAVNDIVRVDDEIMNVKTVGSSDTVTPNMRGDNGSTAATHLINSIVYVWHPMEQIKQACLEITKSAIRRRSGQNMTGTAQVTGAGVVITPQDVPAQAREILEKYKRVQ